MFVSTIVRKSHKVQYLLQFQNLRLFSKVNSLIILHIFIAFFAEIREEESKKFAEAEQYFIV
jgi:septal ring-binding cell division protein DamX